MPELRKDPVVGRWVIIATERARRPGVFFSPPPNTFGADTQECPFCNNKETEIYAVRSDRPNGPYNVNWRVRVVPSGSSVVQINEKYRRIGRGLYDAINGYGDHEVVLETPEHIANMADLDADQIRLVIETYVQRFNELEKNENLHYVFAFKNHGMAAGSRQIGHARSQIIATPVSPSRVKEKLIGAKQYFDYHERCLYCDVIQQELQAKERIIVDNAHFVALTPFAPRFPFETWIIPKRHHCDFAHGVVGQEKELAALLKDILTRFKVGLDDPAYNYVVQTAPFRRRTNGTNRWRTIEEDYHWHIELVPRLTRVAGFEKGTGFYICPIPPEQTAEYLRKVGA